MTVSKRLRPKSKDAPEDPVIYSAPTLDLRPLLRKELWNELVKADLREGYGRIESAAIIATLRGILARAKATDE